MNKSERKEKGKNTAKREIYVVVGILSCVCSLILRIPLLYIIGEKGIAYFGLANEIYIAAGCIFTYGLSMAVSALVRFRVRREQYKNAGRVLRGGFILAAVIGAVLSLVFVFAASVFAKNVIALPAAGLAISMMAPAIVFQMLTGVFRGYFEGNGSRVPSVHSMLIETVVMITGSIIGAVVLYKYGIKVSALLQNENYAFAYGAMGAAVGILAASVLGFLHMLLLYCIYHGSVKKQAARDIQKNQDRGLRIFHILIGTAAPFAGYAALFRVLPLLDGILFIRMAGEAVDSVLLWGSYYGKYLVVTGIICLLITLIVELQVKKIIYYVDREEYKMARDKTGTLVHQTALISVPAAVFTAVLSENLTNLLYKGDNSAAASLIAAGSVIIVLFPFSDLFGKILIRLNKMKYVIGYEAISFVVHIVLVLFLLGNTGLSATALVIANIVSFLILTVLGFLLVSRSLQYRQEWLRSIAFTVITAAIAGLTAMLLNKALSPFAGTTIALFVCLLVSVAVYMVLLIVTKAVTENELKNMPGGGILFMLGRLMKFM